MLRIETQERDGCVLIRLEGKLSGPWVLELEQVYTDTKPKAGGRQVVLDLEGLTGIDSAGRYLAALIERDGARIQTSDLLDTHPLWETKLSHSSPLRECEKHGDGTNVEDATAA